MKSQEKMVTAAETRRYAARLTERPTGSAKRTPKTLNKRIAGRAALGIRFGTPILGVVTPLVFLHPHHERHRNF